MREITDEDVLRFPCKHGKYDGHTTNGNLGPYCDGGPGVRLRIAGSLARSWNCRNCGDDHGGGDGCDNPDFGRLTMYTAEEVT